MFKIRTTKPEKGNKFYTRKASGGYSPCIQGKPTDACDALANCVGYADGRFNEIYAELTGFKGMKYPSFNCDAEDFIERAKSYGLEISNQPVKGGINVWQKGSTLANSDGAGHVCMNEKILAYSAPGVVSKIYTSESGYNSKPFWNSTRTNDNKRWGSGKAYKYRGCIVNPAVVVPQMTSPVGRDITKNQLKTNEGLNIRLGIETTSESIGFVNAGTIFNYYFVLEGKSSYWYAIDKAKTQWIAGKGKNGHKYCDIMPKQEKPTTIVVGSKVKVKKGAKTYSGGRLASWVYNDTFDVIQIKGERTAIGKGKAVTAAMNKKDLILV